MRHDAHDGTHLASGATRQVLNGTLGYIRFSSRRCSPAQSTSELASMHTVRRPTANRMCMRYGTLPQPYLLLRAFEHDQQSQGNSLPRPPYTRVDAKLEQPLPISSSAQEANMTTFGP